MSHPFTRFFVPPLPLEKPSLPDSSPLDFMSDRIEDGGPALIRSHIASSTPFCSEGTVYYPDGWLSTE